VKLSRLNRIMQLLTILQSEHAYSTTELLKITGTSRRTLFRDLNVLKSIGVPVGFDSKTESYRCAPEFFLRPIDLNLSEAMSLFLLVHKTRSHLPLPFKNSALFAGLKIESSLPIQLRRHCSAMLQNVSIRPDSHAPMDLLDSLFSQLQTAIRKKRRMRLYYHSLYDRADITTIFDPYHLRYIRRAWYVIGRSSLHKSLRTFKLNRIKELKSMEQCFVDDHRFNIHDYLGKAWAMMPEGKMYHIKLHFTPKVAENVSEVQWHCSQKMLRNPDGSLTAEFHVDGMGEIIWWILGYGDQVKVLAPAVLRKKIFGIAQRMIRLNK